MANKIKWHKRFLCILSLHDYRIIAKFFWGNVHRAHLKCNRCQEDFVVLSINTEKSNEKIGYVSKVSNEDRETYKTLFNYDIK